MPYVGRLHHGNETRGETDSLSVTFLFTRDSSGEIHPYGLQHPRPRYSSTKRYLFDVSMSCHVSMQWLAVFCVLGVGASTEPWSAELVAMEKRHAAELAAVRHEFYQLLQDVRKCSGCMSPSPPPPSPSPPPPTPPPPTPPPPSPSPPPSPKPPCATPIDFALVLDESGSMNNDMEGPNGLKAFAKELVCHAAMEPR